VIVSIYLAVGSRFSRPAKFGRRATVTLGTGSDQSRCWVTAAIAWLMIDMATGKNIISDVESDKVKGWRQRPFELTVLAALCDAARAANPGPTYKATTTSTVSTWGAAEYIPNTRTSSFIGESPQGLLSRRALSS
jgi:hypothetical protein